MSKLVTTVLFERHAVVRTASVTLPAEAIELSENVAIMTRAEPALASVPLTAATTTAGFDEPEMPSTRWPLSSMYRLILTAMLRKFSNS